ncbi:hypothetical protein GCM10010404_20680 [Nonomuraea africana]|uniref:LPXTG cell wall anchor domain-containing protein n=1 Tax=Nonomuraea africana TaxID=46171 RepID=A0ABR9KTG6_9ACTN|nr:hypothetical protein [Nonomuraea africana]MBE1565328.1 hypothetical protein [Nonomuraea africana]
MQKSKARRRLALKTSALGLAGTLALFVGSVVGLAGPAEAAAVDKTMDVVYSCNGGPFNESSLTVRFSAPDPVTAGGTLAVKWTIPQLTLKQAPTAAGRVKVSGKLVVTGGTATDLVGQQAGTITSGQVSIPTADVTSNVTVTGTTGGKVNIKPSTEAGSLKLTVGDSTTEVHSCSTTSTSSMEVSIGQGTGTGTGTSDIAEYNCTLKSGSTTDTEYPVYPEIKLELTPPTSARTNEEITLTWRLTNQDDAEKLKVPAAGLTGTNKLFMSFTGSGAGLSATLTGEGAISAGTTTGADITLPSVTLKAKATTVGTASLKPGNFTIGTAATTSTIECALQNATELKAWTYQVTAGSTSPSPSPSPSATTTGPKPTRTVTATVTQTPVGAGNGKVTKTPKGAAETGGGGDMGPDGRMFVLTGSLIVLAAAAGGLVLRRRTLSRG